MSPKPEVFFDQKSLKCLKKFLRKKTWIWISLLIKVYLLNYFFIFFLKKIVLVLISDIVPNYFPESSTRLSAFIASSVSLKSLFPTSYNFCV